jgi:Domain of unknown function (DUF4123)
LNLQTSPNFANAHPPQIDRISRALHEAARTDGGDMLWLAIDADNAAASPLPDEIRSVLNSPMAQIVPVRHRAVDESLWPRWLPLDTACVKGSLALRQGIEHALAELTPHELRQGKGRRIAGWLTLDSDLAEAAGHWGRQMIRTHPGGRRRLLRMHDPAVLWALWPLLTGPQQRELLGPVSAWWLLDPRGELAVLRAPAASADAAQAEPWSDALWRDIDHICALNAALRDWLPTLPVDMPWPLARARDIATQAIRRAHAAGFRQTQDLAAYATHALAIHPAFDDHPLVRRLLAARGPQDRYTALVEALNERDWLDVREGRNAG